MAENVKQIPAVLTDKKALLNWRTNHDLHVLMIMKQHGLTKAQALVQAYHEGSDGLSKRLA
jgi:hypothetical protein